MIHPQPRLGQLSFYSYPLVAVDSPYGGVILPLPFISSRSKATLFLKFCSPLLPLVGDYCS